MQFFYSATNGSDTGSVVAAVVGNEATANLSDLLPATTYTVYGVVTATNGSTPQSSSTTFTTEGARTDHAAWYELPAKDNAGSNMLLRTFYDTARNYTMYYDTSTYTAYWVAYPLAAGDLGSGRPNDPWAATPGIPTSQQINVWAGSYGVNVGSTSNIYARGHQIPNADRNKDPYGTMCAQTFYATNSTPQIQNGFNSGIWSTLEGDVRTLAQQQTDTVYVVTGAILRTVTGNETITYIKPAKDTKNCPVPNYYYKVLLKVKREASGKISSASTVGVWLPHRVYSGESYQSYTKSVAEIEALTGYNFFANLPADIQAAAEQNSNWIHSHRSKRAKKPPIRQNDTHHSIRCVSFCIIHTSERLILPKKQLSLRIGKPPNPKTDTRSGCNEEAGIFCRIRRRQTANIRSTRPVIVHEVPPNAENEKNTKSKPGSPSISRDPAPLCYDSSPKTSGRNSGACPCSAHCRRSRPASCWPTTTYCRCGC